MKHGSMRLLCLVLALCLALPSALAYEKLQRGDINSDVMNMQLALKSLGYTLSADGNFGSGTQRVVKAFQQRYGLKADGIAGNETLSLLYSLAPAYDPDGGNASNGNGNSGSTGGISATVVTTGGTLNLRATASSIAQVITTIPNGASVTISQLGASWCAVIYNGYHGYVMTEFLRVGTAAAPTATPVPPAGNTGGEWARVVTTGGSLNLRAAARDTAAVKTTIPYGTQVYVNNRGSSWCAVTYNGYTGYVMTKFLSFNPSATAAPVITPAPTQKPSGSSGTIAYVQTTGGSLNLRAEAKSGAKVLTTIPYGTQLTITSVGSTWCGTYYNGYSGYVMTSFLRFVSVQPTLAPTLAPTPTQNTTVIGGEAAYVTTSGGSLNLRAEARSGAKVLTTIPNNTQLTITNRGSSWCATYYNGFSGYVMTSFLRFASAGQNTQAPTPTPTPTPSSGTTDATYAIVTTSGGTLNLRAAASTTAKVIGQIPNGSSLQVYSRGSSWCAVSYNGTSGYVMTSYLTFLSNPGTDSGNIGGGTNTDAPTSEEESDPSKYKRTLKSGMTGEDVIWVQTRLEELGYSVKITGIYDGNTISAVKAFQKQNGLDADGLAGAQTFTILASDNARKASDAAISYTTLRIDDTKAGVTSLQKALKELGYPLTVNGEYDPDTHNAVVAFQQRNSLVISGIADSLTQHVLFGSGAKPYSTYVAPVDLSGAYMAAPAISEVKLLHWQDEIKPTVKAGQTITILEPQSGLSWSISFYSLGRHADSQPTSWRDTQIMNVALGKSDWTVHPVYVKLPDGRWTMATMHNRPHLYGSIMNNGFGGHLCIHFLRDMDEAIRNDPNYGVQNQKTLRSAWKALTGETID